MMTPRIFLFAFALFTPVTICLAGKVDEIPSEDSVIPRLHSMGLINGKTDIYRCANPVIAVAEKMKDNEPSPKDLDEAVTRMRRLAALGVHTVICLEQQIAPDPKGPKNSEHLAVDLEQKAAEAAGIRYVAYPMSGKGPNSFETMTDQETFDLLNKVSDDLFRDAQTGGVAFHCKAGHDRTGLLAAFLRVKYQHWTADQAIAEMRRDGHSWQKFAKPGAQYSWLEEHLKAAAGILASGKVKTAT